jgi:exodeoxyribonuclease VII small subunit
MAKKENKTFEEKITRLEEIVKILDEDSEPLETQLILFEEGTKLINELRQILNNAELKIKNISTSTDENPNFS